MPSSLRIKLQCDPEKKHGYYISSLFHGALMDMLEPEYADALHENGFHPFSQFISDKGDHLIWTVSALNWDAEENILTKLQEDEFCNVHLEHRDEDFQVCECTVSSISYQGLMNDFFFEKQDRILRLKFLSPVSFKQNGRYTIFPTVRLIFQSLMLRYDAFSDKHSVLSDEVLEHFEKYIKIVGYNLRSTVFHMESVKIPSFIGTVTLKINGPQQLVNLAWMLAEFGIYSGVGIKVSMGMGAMDIVGRNVLGKGKLHE